jgi:hypothetical protein
MGFVIFSFKIIPMKRRLLDLVIVYLLNFATLLLYIYLIHASVSTAITSLTIWLLPLIVVLPTQFIAFLITVKWPESTPQIDNRIYRITQGVVYTLIVTMVGISFIKEG